MKAFSFEGFIEKLKWIYFIELMSSKVFSFLCLCQTESTLQSAFFPLLMWFHLSCAVQKPHLRPCSEMTKEAIALFKEYWQVFLFFSKGQDKLYVSFLIKLFSLLGWKFQHGTNGPQLMNLKCKERSKALYQFCCSVIEFLSWCVLF